MNAYAPASLRARFAADSIGTASPQRLLVMLYDRLDLDLRRAEAALDSGDREVSHAQLIHAQAIVSELLSSLDTEAWDGGPGLASLYTWALNELVQANLHRDADTVADVRETMAPLRQAWQDALNQLAGAGNVTAGLAG